MHLLREEKRTLYNFIKTSRSIVKSKDTDQHAITSAPKLTTELFLIEEGNNLLVGTEINRST